MSNAKQFDWVDFYKELAGKLLQYKNNRKELIEKVLKIYEITGIKLPTLERKGHQIVDIDPFTVFGLFNKNKVQREKIIHVVAELFGISAPEPTSFDGIPVLNGQNATFYNFLGEREDSEIDNLWGLFETVLAYSTSPSQANRAKVSKFFDLTINRRWNGNAKITMGMFWIAPKSFLNLDQHNIRYIYKSGKIPANLVKTLPPIKTKDKIHASEYFDILEKVKAFLQSGKSSLKNFMELSFEAWQYSRHADNEQDEDFETKHYWIYSPGEGAAIWDECCKDGIMAIGWDQIGDLSKYNSKEEMKHAMKEKIDSSMSYKHTAHATWQFVHEMKPGDVVFAKKGRYLLVGRGVVESGYKFDSSRQHYKNVRKVKWTHEGEWEHPGQAAMKTLTDITTYPEYVKKLNALFESDMIVDDEDQEIKYPSYDPEQFLEEVYMDKESYEQLEFLIKKKKNVILQGAPGVGKTFIAQKLAYARMGVINPDRVMMVQFHQSYSYEDFIIGFRPSENGFERVYGTFYDFCTEARIDSENDYFFIIDEINRGNLSKIFGELFMLIENDKRGVELSLLYSKEKFSIPENVYIIGTMNTADRSLAMLDYALRRRFSFYEIKPGFESEGFIDYQTELADDKFNKLVDTVKKLNEAIARDPSLGEGFCIGHSYFCNLEEVTDQDLHSIVEYDLIPLLKEYWFDEPDKVRNWITKLRSAIQ